jgi:diguanylate cyclase (GGDEF)-like protein/PAS domain S-box-containing protein
MLLSAPERSLLDDLALPAAVLDHRGWLLWANRTLAVELGRARETLAGTAFLDLFRPADPKGLSRALAALAAGEEEARFRTLPEGGEGHSPRAWCASPRSGEAEGILVVAESAAGCRQEARLAEAQRMAALGSWEWDIASGQLWWSEEIYRIFGLDPQRFQPNYDAFLHAIHPDDRAFVQAAVDAAMEGTPYAIDHRIVRPDGSERLVHEQGAVRFDEAGRPRYMRGTVQDITARKTAEEALRAKEARQRQLLDGLAEGVFGVDREDRITFLNRSACAMFRLGAESEALGLHHHALIHHTDASGWPYPVEQCPIRQVVATGQSREAWEDRFFRVNGKDFPVEVYASPLRDESGAVEGAVVSFRDISERRALEAARSQLVAILEATPDFVSFADPDGTVRYINRGGREMLDLPGADGAEEELPPELREWKQAGCYAHPEWARRLVQDEGIPTAIREGQWRGETALLDAQGNEIPVSQVILAHYDEAGELARLSTIMRDISEQKRLEEQLEEQATHDLLTGVSNRLRFEQVLSHEIHRSDRDRTPLSLIMFDLDHFKEVNDTCGHAVGDTVLTEVAERVARAIRSSDLLARWGGEEFMVLLPETGRTGAYNLAEKLRLVVAETSFPEVGPLTISLGVTQRRPGEAEDPLLSRVDSALYRAKSAGRNRVVYA